MLPLLRRFASPHSSKSLIQHRLISFSSKASSASIHSNTHLFLKLATLTSLILIGGHEIFVAKRHTAFAKDSQVTPDETEQEESEDEEEQKIRSTLPIITQDEVSKHNSVENGGIWVTYKMGVYDITKFVQAHPGGTDKIMMAAGSAVDPFWEVYQFHKHDKVKNILKSYRIGTLDKPPVKIELLESDPFAKDPWDLRVPILKVHSKAPYNAETPATLMSQNYLTPNKLFFVRGHFPVPNVDASQYKLEISGKGIDQPKTLTLDEIKTLFPKEELTAYIQCAGNRRTYYDTHNGTIKGLPWDIGAVGNAQWGGVRLRDVLLWAGFKVDESHIGSYVSPDGVQHVHLHGLDKDPLAAPDSISPTAKYAVSIPLEKAIAPSGDVLLAYEMNGEPIPRDHGFPLRAVVPGSVGVRSVKWLGKIVTCTDESQSFWQQSDYKLLPPTADWTNADFSKEKALHDTPIQSSISTAVVEGEEDDRWLSLSGYALSGGGRAIKRIDFSVDGGKTWSLAELRPKINLQGDEIMQNQGRAWGWTLWDAFAKLPEGLNPGDKITACVRAVDSACNVQPKEPDQIWNLRGLCCNSWHCKSIEISKSNNI